MWPPHCSGRCVAQGTWALTLGSYTGLLPGLLHWALTLGSYTGLLHWALTLGSYTGLLHWALTLGSYTGLLHWALTWALTLGSDTGLLHWALTLGSYTGLLPGLLPGLLHCRYRGMLGRPDSATHLRLDGVGRVSRAVHDQAIDHTPLVGPPPLLRMKGTSSVEVVQYFGSSIRGQSVVAFQRAQPNKMRTAGWAGIPSSAACKQVD